VRIKWARKKANSCVHDAPGDLVHVDIKKLGRIPNGGGWRFLGRAEGKRRKSRPVGYWYIHNAVDDCSRLGYSELLEDERKETAAAFWGRANAYFESAGITVKRVLTDNGACYRSKDFPAALGEQIAHKRGVSANGTRHALPEAPNMVVHRGCRMVPLTHCGRGALGAAQPPWKQQRRSV
jgi:hypothetical protein